MDRSKALPSSEQRKKGSLRERRRTVIRLSFCAAILLTAVVLSRIQSSNGATLGDIREIFGRGGRIETVFTAVGRGVAGDMAIGGVTEAGGKEAKAETETADAAGELWESVEVPMEITVRPFVDGE